MGWVAFERGLKYLYFLKRKIVLLSRFAIIFLVNAIKAQFQIFFLFRPNIRRDVVDSGLEEEEFLSRLFSTVNTYTRIKITRK